MNLTRTFARLLKTRGRCTSTDGNVALSVRSGMGRKRDAALSLI